MSTDLVEAKNALDALASQQQTALTEAKAAAAKDMDKLEAKFNAQFEELKAGGVSPAKLSGIESDVKQLHGLLSEKQDRLDALDSIVNNFNQQRDTEAKSLGELFTQTQELTDYLGTKQSGNLAGVAIKALDTPTAGAALIRPDVDPTIYSLPRDVFALRGLIPSFATTSNTTEFIRMMSRVNNAAPVVEGAQKPDSDWTFDTVQCPIRTIAHGVPITRQFYDDVNGLRALVDSNLVYGLVQAEELQLLLGDGTGENVTGILPQATAYSAAAIPTTTTTMVDTIRWAKRQVRMEGYIPDGIVINPEDLAIIDLIKDGNGLYQFANWRVGGEQQPSLWGLSVRTSNAITAGTFLVGAFGTQARIRDRMEIELAMTDTHGDFFMKNKYQLRAEKRVGLEVIRPTAFVTGSF